MCRTSNTGMWIRQIVYAELWMCVRTEVCVCVVGGLCLLSGLRQNHLLYLGEGCEYCLVCVKVEALILLVWAVWHSGRMCSSLRNSLVLLAGEGGPAMTANKGTAHTHTQFRVKICTMSTQCVCVCVCVRE